MAAHEGVGGRHRVHRRGAVAARGRVSSRRLDLGRPAPARAAARASAAAASSARARTSGRSASSGRARVADEAEADRPGPAELRRRRGRGAASSTLGRHRGTGRVRVHHERLLADEEHAVVGARGRRAMAGGGRVEHPLPQRVERREDARGRGAARRAPGAERLGQRDDARRRPPTRPPRRRATMATCPTAGPREEVGELVEAARHAMPRSMVDGARRARRPPPGRGGPSAATRTPGLPARCGGVVERPPHDRAQLAGSADLVGPLHGPAGQLHERARQQRVGDDVPVVLLAGGHDERRAVGTRVGEVADGVAEPGRGVEVEEGRTTRGLGVAVGHRRPTVASCRREHVVEVVGVGQGVDERAARCCRGSRRRGVTPSVRSTSSSTSRPRTMTGHPTGGP